MAKQLDLDKNKMKILKFFHDTGEFYDMEEMLTLIPKITGINDVNHVKEAIRALLYDGSIERKLIGTTVCYWSFPSFSKTLNARKRKLEELQELYNNKRLKTTKNAEHLNEIKRILADIKQLKKRKIEVLQQLETIEDDYDPNIIEQISKRIDLVRSRINLWTEHIIRIKIWYQDKYTVEHSAIVKKFGLADLELFTE